QAHKALRARNQIIKFDNRARNARWTIGANNGPRTTIPRVRFGEDYKITAFGDNIPDGLAEQGHAFLKALTTIVMTAHRLNEGVPSEVLEKRLRREKVNLNITLAKAEKFTFLLTQIINN